MVGYSREGLYLLNNNGWDGLSSMIGVFWPCWKWSCCIVGRRVACSVIVRSFGGFFDGASGSLAMSTAGETIAFCHGLSGQSIVLIKPFILGQVSSLYGHYLLRLEKRD